MKRDLHERLQRLRDKGKRLREELRAEIELDGRRLTLYNAGLKGDKAHFGLFGRDLLMTALMLNDLDFTQSAIRFVCETIGERFDPSSGEEPGRGLHEFSRVEMRGLFTHYNAAEVSLLLLIAADRYLQKSGDTSLIEEELPPLRAAVEYLLRHIEDGFFVEDPHRCGADRYALQATYWKDSHLPGRDDPSYPVVYTLVQAQAIAALRAAARLQEHLQLAFDTPHLEATLISRLLTDLWDARTSYPLIAIDREGGVHGISSDGLHLLSYLLPGDLPKDKLAGIVANAHHLATPVGYRTYAPGQPDYSPHAYHLGGIWPMEQYFIARGALIHAQPELLEVALQVVEVLEELGFVEIYYWEEGMGLAGPRPDSLEGCDLQLWSTAVPNGLLSLL